MNFRGSWVQTFQKCCKHWRFHSTMRTDPKVHLTLKAKQNIDNAVLKDMMHGDSAFQQAANLFGTKCIMAIFDENQFGLRKTQLDNHLPEKLQTPHVTRCIYKCLEATMDDKAKLGDARFHVISKGLEFCRVVDAFD